MAPLITFVSVVYNAVSTLEDTINSVISLNYPNKKHIIIDGGSTDGTVSLIKKYEDKIDYWISEPDKGIYDAMNKGWKQASIDSYILFLGDGDKIISVPNSINESFSKVYYGNVFIGDKLFKSTHNFKIKLGNTIHHQALLIPKLLHDVPPFDLEYKIYADFDFNQRLLKKGVKFEYKNDLQAYALPGGISGKRVEKEMLQIVRKNFGPVMSFLASVYYWFQRVKSLNTFGRLFSIRLV